MKSLYSRKCSSLDKYSHTPAIGASIVVNIFTQGYSCSSLQLLLPLESFIHYRYVRQQLEDIFREFDLVFTHLYVTRCFSSRIEFSTNHSIASYFIPSHSIFVYQRSCPVFYIICNLFVVWSYQ